ncbi:MAG: acyl-CoA dehydrogenase family protein, partial [Desulfotomaculaceae bacterium]
MDFTFNEDLQLMAKTVKDFVDKEVDPLAYEIDENDKIPEHIIEQCKEMGLFGLSTPEEYDGLGLGMVGKCLIFEQLGRTCNGFTTLLGAHNGIGTVGIVELGTEK